MNQIIKNKIKSKIALTTKEIATYYRIEEKIVKNIFIMYEYSGGKSIVSKTLSSRIIDEIIKLRYPQCNKVTDVRHRSKSLTRET